MNLFLALLEGCAKATRANTVYVKDGERMKGKVMKLARQTITSIEEITNVTFDSIPENKIEITGLDRARVAKKYLVDFLIAGVY